MTDLKRKVVAVTGAASGIGRALARQLVKRGAHVALSDIDERGLNQTASMLSRPVRVTTHVVDVRDREAVERYAAEVKSQHGGADVIINNAGVSVRGSMEELSYEDIEFVINVNLWGVIYGTKAFLPLFRERGAGHIVNIGSINSMVPFPKQGPYNISKYGVYGFNETLMQELRGEPIRVTSVHPGGIQTNIAHNARNITGKETALFSAIAMTTADAAATSILKAVERNQECVQVGADSKLMATAKRVAPGLTVAIMGVIASEVASMSRLRRARSS